MSTTSSKSASRAALVVWWAIAAPPLILAVALALLLIGVGPVRDRFWPLPALNLSEAATLTDAAALVEQLRNGANPDLVYPVRPPILSHEVRVRPLEAAAASGRTEIAELLLDAGAHPDRDQIARIFCLAEESHSEQLSAFLRQRLGPAPAANCESGQRPF